MAAKSRFTRLDAFTKTVDEARINRRITVHPELVVDKGRGEKMEIHLNITFPKIPCELLTLDVMDVSGEQQVGVMHGVKKVRLTPQEEGGKVIDNYGFGSLLILILRTAVFATVLPLLQMRKSQAAVIPVRKYEEAYASVSWAFGRGENVEQCEREHYSERLDSQRKEGCRIEGGLRVNKVIGNFHIAPGRSFTNGNMHVHDLNNYF
ncbi:hypothetical protein DID88_007688 [Monilinia fructigena]|uniref:Endoplasmic reticulum-Golgi intermediate compartment protein n=1 Tax=Monilinia fructigena TaxID=38457 RepID=A0A395J3R1_9HELO|nr:hypothetical protein DID88_007688 [Monilinia fructigena]